MVGAGLGNGKGNRPRKALTAAAPGYSPKSPGCLLTNPPPVGLLICNLEAGGGGKPNKDCLFDDPREFVGLLGS